jgi:hypothetical protein
VFKVFTFYAMKKVNMFGINNTGALIIPESAKKLIREAEYAKEKDAIVEHIISSRKSSRSKI